MVHEARAALPTVITGVVKRVGGSWDGRFHAGSFRMPPDRTEGRLAPLVAPAEAGRPVRCGESAIWSGAVRVRRLRPALMVAGDRRGA